MKSAIYLDYAATTPLDTRVAEKMSRFLTVDGCFGNPSSVTHVFGRAAKNAVEEAREHVAHLIHADPQEIIWTSGATEADNLALKGAAQLYQRKGKHIITLKTEHKAVLDTCQQLEKEGFSVTYLNPQRNGILNLGDLSTAIRPDTIIVSIMHVNNETGVIQDLKAIAALTSAKGILLHVDAAQSAGKLEIDVQAIPIDLLSLSAHKIYGPKGIGALYVRKKPRVKVAAQIHGGGQEQGMRSGTLATHQIVGMGEAFRLAKWEREKDFNHVNQLRNMLFKGLKMIPDVVINGAQELSYPGITNICIPGIKSADFMQEFPELAIVAGSACLTKGIEPSYVLRAMGLNKEQAQSSLRLSYGRFSTLSDIHEALYCLTQYIAR